MLLDKQNLLSDQQSLILALAGAQNSTNVLDLGATGTIPGSSLSPISDPGRSDVTLLAQITEAVLSAGAATMEFKLVMADSADLATNPVVLQSTDALAKATLIAGYQLRLGATLPPGITKRYLGMTHTNAVAATTAGKITAGIVFDRQTNLSSL